MASPQYGTPIIVQYGNASSMTMPPGPPVIDSRVFTNLGSTLAPPSFARNTRPPILERVTPRSMNAGLTLRTNAARVRIALRDGRNRTVNTVKGYGRSAGLRAPTVQYGFDEIFKIFGRGNLRLVPPPGPTTTATRVK